MGNNLLVNFNSAGDAMDFLGNMAKTDEHYDVYVNQIVTGEEDGQMTFSALTTSGEKIKVNVLDVAMRSLERRSGDDAKGHELMTNAQIMNSMNNYWKLHNSKEVCEALIRDGELLQLESAQYMRFEQKDLMDSVVKFLEEKYKDNYEFVRGSYEHSMTEIVFELRDALNESYKKAWLSANLGQAALDKSKVYMMFKTNDIGTSVAGVYTEMRILGTRLAIGEPINVIHRNGHGSLQDFKDALDQSIVTLKEELNALARLMSLEIAYPEQALIRAIRASGLVGISKKACKELIADMLFSSDTTAYMLYIYIHGFLQTEHGSNLSEERKARAISACRKLLSVDWKQFDIPGYVKL